MAKIKTCEVTGVALDLLVSRAGNLPGRDGWGWFERDGEGFLSDPLNERRYSPSTIWAQGGPIIEREELSISCEPDGKWHSESPSGWQYGPTALIAAMRCFVASKLGDEVDVPEELL